MGKLGLLENKETSGKAQGQSPAGTVPSVQKVRIGCIGGGREIRTLVSQRPNRFSRAARYDHFGIPPHISMAVFLRRSQKFLPPNSFAKFVIYNVRLPFRSNYFYKHTKLIYLYRCRGSHISRIVFNIRESRSLRKYLIMLRARSALPYLPIHRSASVGRSLAGRPPGGGLRANF